MSRHRTLVATNIASGVSIFGVGGEGAHSSQPAKLCSYKCRTANRRLPVAMASRFLAARTAPPRELLFFFFFFFFVQRHEPAALS